MLNNTESRMKREMTGRSARIVITKAKQGNIRALFGWDQTVICRFWLLLSCLATLPFLLMDGERVESLLQ
jgi:hypothetical protein